MKHQGLVRVGTVYLPVMDVDVAAEWYVRSLEEQSANFFDHNGSERFSMTFEVDGLCALDALHNEYLQKDMKVGEIEGRGHAGKNFVFYDLDGNMFDVWSELSPTFKEND